MATPFIRLPQSLIEKVNALAFKEGVTPEELICSAVEARLSRDEWLKTLNFGDRNALKRGLKPDDVDAEIAAVRSEQAL